jgi:hypothetical protein
MVCEKEKAVLNRTFEVKKEWKIGNCKMKVGDILKVVDYGMGMANNYVVFENLRIKSATFKTATWLFKQNTEEKRLCPALEKLIRNDDKFPNNRWYVQQHIEEWHDENGVCLVGKPKMENGQLMYDKVQTDYVGKAD